MNPFFLLFFSFIIGYISALIIAKFGIRWGLEDFPSARSSHKNPTPKGGGIGIPLSLIIVSYLFLGKHYFFLSFAVILVLISFLNDKLELSIVFRLALQIIISLLLLLVYKKEWISQIHNSYGLLILLFGVIILTTYIVAATNFFNFMDGINGIAGLEAIISFGFLGFFVLLYKDMPNIAIISFSVSTSALGFIILNFPNAKVFMGDVGSIFIGFLYASLVIYLATTLEEFFLFAAFQSVFYIDAASTIIKRLYNKENILRAHRKHLYQQLVHYHGWSHLKVSIYFIVAQIIVSLTALGLYHLGTLFQVLFWISLITLYWIISHKFRSINST